MYIDFMRLIFRFNIQTHCFCYDGVVITVYLSFAFHIKTTHLICCEDQMSDFYMKCNTGLKRVNHTEDGAGNATEFW